ncbi:hypothetical protein [Methylococcus mesophilus]|uniref:hypothetical protein n=1 Tax=Methylococcus mesophilus TaxID=2993564 RepID=UPI00224B4139|nr:hypothetical protein [Methylococcus mesophilus]UZR28077.1 hypothetical protein OOT43_15365 [Methylococcus mesophilus]
MLTLTGCCSLELWVTLAPRACAWPVRATDLVAGVDEVGLALRCDEPEPDER